MLLRSVPSIAIVSIVLALLLALAERVGARRKQLPDVWPRWPAGGAGAGTGVAPGGVAFRQHPTAALDGWQRADAARFPTLGIPAITIAGLVELKDALAASPGTRCSAVARRNCFSCAGVVAGDRLVAEVPSAQQHLALRRLPAAVRSAATGLVGRSRRTLRSDEVGLCGMSHLPELLLQLWIQPAVVVNRSRRLWRPWRPVRSVRSWVLSRAISC